MPGPPCPPAVRRRLAAALAFAALAGGAAACGTAASPPRATRTADTTADTTAGYPAPRRPVSDIVAPRWTDERVRDRQGEAARVFAHLALAPGMAVADIGAGDGYYVARLVPLLGDSGVIYGQDVRDDYLDLLRDRARRAGWRTVRIVLGTEDDARLPASAVDVALMIHMYHEIAQPFALLARLATSMRPGGRLAILDRDAPTDAHGTPIALLNCELRAVGYEPVSRIDMEPGEYLAVFRAPPTAPAPQDIAERLRAGRCG
ncbi:MAG: methyltransferase domain-containing protein [Gemmatimonadetes bacterium]|nr:methyltransferase domain-containing protein [Gemmatimonadota bacterium]